MGNQNTKPVTNTGSGSGSGNDTTNNKQNTTTTSQLNKVNRYPFGYIAVPVLLSDGKSILISPKNEMTENERNPMIVIDSSDGRIIKEIQYPKTGVNLKYHSIAYDPQTELVYVVGGKYHRCFMIYDLNQQKWDVKVGEDTDGRVAEEVYNVKDVGVGCGAIVDHYGTLHVIGGSKNSAHFTLNTHQSNNNRFIETAVMPFENIFGFGLLHDVKKNRLILIGGWEIDTSTYKPRYLSSIFFFDLSIKKWSTFDGFRLPIPLAFAGYILIQSEEIIIVFGGETMGYQECDSIFILDLKEQKCYENGIGVKCPKKGAYHAAVMNNNNGNNGGSQSSTVHLFQTYATAFDHYLLPSPVPILIDSNGTAAPAPAPPPRPPSASNNNDNNGNNGNSNSNSNSNADPPERKDNEEEEEEEDQPQQRQQQQQQRQPQPKQPALAPSLLRRYFFSTVKFADRYYPAFVAHGYNDFAALMAFENTESDIQKLVVRCGMDEIHAKRLINSIQQLKKKNARFQQWIENTVTVEEYDHLEEDYYQKFLSADIITLDMLQNRFESVDEFIRFLGGEEYEEEARRMWERMPKNVRKRKVRMKKEERMFRIIH